MIDATSNLRNNIRAVSEQQRNVSNVFHQCFNTPSGRQVIEYLQSVTLDLPSYETGMSTKEIVFKEGQDYIVRHIKRHIELAQEK